jgi:hypothetical protein
VCRNHGPFWRATVDAHYENEDTLARLPAAFAEGLRELLRGWRQRAAQARRGGARAWRPERGLLTAVSERRVRACATSASISSSLLAQMTDLTAGMRRGDIDVASAPLPGQSEVTCP